MLKTKQLRRLPKREAKQTRRQFQKLVQQNKHSGFARNFARKQEARKFITKNKHVEHHSQDKSRTCCLEQQRKTKLFETFSYQVKNIPNVEHEPISPPIFYCQSCDRHDFCHCDEGYIMDMLCDEIDRGEWSVQRKEQNYEYGVGWRHSIENYDDDELMKPVHKRTLKKLHEKMDSATGSEDYRFWRTRRNEFLIHVDPRFIARNKLAASYTMEDANKYMKQVQDIEGVMRKLKRVTEIESMLGDTKDSCNFPLELIKERNMLEKQINPFADLDEKIKQCKDYDDRQYYIDKRRELERELDPFTEINDGIRNSEDYFEDLFSLGENGQRRKKELEDKLNPYSEIVQRIRDADDYYEEQYWKDKQNQLQQRLQLDDSDDDSRDSYW